MKEVVPESQTEEDPPREYLPVTGLLMRRKDDVHPRGCVPTVDIRFGPEQDERACVHGFECDNQTITVNPNPTIPAAQLANPDLGT